MMYRIRVACISVLLLLGYATLLTGGNLPQTNWQMAIISCQSMLLTFLTGYVGRSAFYIRKLNENGDLNKPTRASLEELLRDGIQQLPCAVVLADSRTSRLQFANHASFKLFGIEWLPDNQMTQRGIDELFRFTRGVETPSTFEVAIEVAIQRREQVVARDLKILRPNGQQIEAAVTSIPLFNLQGECESVLMLVEDMTEHYRQLQRIENIAYCDPLTGLANRLSILQRIQESFDRTEQGHFALLFMDFDRFKLINDSLGHEVGDQLLVEIGQRITQSIRSTDFVSTSARLGGDEFVVLLDHLPDPCVASTIADRILNAVNQPYYLAGNTVVSTASIGVVTSSHRPDSASDMLRKADLAMYKSKSEGKARYSMFDESLERQAEQRLLLENELRSAVKYDEFDFDIQPIIQLATGQIVAGEALLRWQHPRLGRVSANQFMGVACESGVIVPIGDQLLRRATQFLQRSVSDDQQWHLHINISRIQLLLPQLLETLDEALGQTKIDPGKLVFEVAEISINGELDEVVRRCVELKQRGIKLCLDNFGSGASSLALLRRLPLDYLKLDRSLIQGIHTSPDSLVLLEAFLTIAENYKIKVIAEGIECDTQRQKLMELGCEYGQGFAVHSPIGSKNFQVEKLPPSSFLTPVSFTNPLPNRQSVYF